MYIIFLGAPGAGKGTQASEVAKEMSLAHIATGDLFRSVQNQGTDLAMKARSFMEKGLLVPDEITIQMVLERIAKPDCAGGVIFDGFPRNLKQAEALDATLAKMGWQIGLVPFISVPKPVLLNRLTGRWTCRESGHIFHTMFNPPAQPGICDLDGSELYQRPDDTPETVSNRVKVYFDQTAPLIDYYKEMGILVEIDGNQDIETVNTALLDLFSAVE